MIRRANIVVIKESASMGSLYTIYADGSNGHDAICKDLPRGKALKKLDNYLLDMG
jgi:hypothetical protein